MKKTESQNLEVTTFKNNEFGEIKTIDINGNPWFVGKEVANKLGYSDTDQALRKNCKYVKSLKGVPATGLTSSPRGINIIPESDLYRLVMRSKLPSAQRFQDWVCNEVLPSIRKHGAYLTPDTLEKTIADPDFMIGLLQKLKEEQTGRIKAERERVWISDRKTATAMATASKYSKQNRVLKRENEKLQKRIDVVAKIGEQLKMINK